MDAICALIEHGPEVSREFVSHLMDELQGAILFDVTHHVGILDRARARNIIANKFREAGMTVKEG